MTFDYQAARLTMVESQVRTSDVTDLHVQDAMRIAPREALCPAGKKLRAARDLRTRRRRDSLDFSVSNKHANVGLRRGTGSVNQRDMSDCERR